MIIFPKFNPIEFRYTFYDEQNYEKDFTNYNPCRNNFIIGENEKISFSFYVNSGQYANTQIFLLNEVGVVQSWNINATNGNLYPFEIPMAYGLGVFSIMIQLFDNIEGRILIHSEKIICTDNLQYTRLLSWKKSGNWLGYNLNQLYTNNNSFVFTKRLDISTYKNKSFGVNNIVFQNGWGKYEIVDSYPTQLLNLNIGYIQGLNEYTQELISLLRSMDYLGLDDDILQITEDTEYELIDSDEFDDRKGVLLSNLSPYKNEYNANIFYQPNRESLLDGGVWILQGGTWNADGIWTNNGVWVA